MNRNNERKLLGDFLSNRRARLSPDQVGLLAGGRRRTPGLRREEVAQLAGISVTWYTWLEQGRAIQVSDSVLENIAQALHLTSEERRYLFTLAGRQPESAQAVSDAPLNPTLQVILDHLGEYPAYVLGKCWDLLAWNAAAALLFGDFAELATSDRNLIWYMFGRPATRDLVIGWPARARHLIAEFRADVSLALSDPPLIAFVARMSQISPEFADWWRSQDVVGKTGGKREFHHAQVGYLILEQTTFRVSSSPEIKLVLHVPLEESADKLRSLYSGAITDDAQR